jgi:SUKH-4 immunity protein
MTIISPSDFKRAWIKAGDALFAYSDIALAGVPIPNDAKQFLLQAGLPEQAAPFLMFRTPGSGPLQSAAAEYGFSDKLDDRFVIGSTGAGDPIVVSTDGVVSSLNHDAAFAGCYMNASVPHLAMTLLRFRDLVSSVERAHGPDADVDGRVPQTLLSDFTSFLRTHDPAALTDGAFWLEEVSDWSHAS